MKIDNFMLTNWQSCPTKYQLGIRDSWQPKMKSAALGYGAVVHEGLAEWYRTGMQGLNVRSRLEAAIAKIQEKFPVDHPVDDHRNLNKAEELMRAYVNEYPGENFQVLQVEVPFTLSLGLKLNWCPACEHFNSDNWIKDFDICQSCGADLEEIEYGGILDLISAFGPVLYVMDHKTTSELGALFFRQFETSNQMTGYCWGLSRLSSKRVAGANINALCTTRGGKISFKRETTNRSEADFETWKRHIQTECNGLKRNQLTGVFPHRTEHCLTKYGLCPYHGVCTLSTDAERQRSLEAFYEQRPWDHELRDLQKASGDAS